MDYLGGVISRLYSNYYKPSEPETLCDKSRQMVENLVTQSKLVMDHSGLLDLYKHYVI